jgi:transposase-like protein
MSENKRKRYTDDFRASAVLMLEAAGYPDREGGLSQVSSHLGVPISTIRGWYLGTRNPPPPELRNEKRFDLLEAIQTELAAIFPAMATRREDASYRELGTVAGILMDKQLLLTGKATWRGELIDLLKQGVIAPDAVAAELGDDLATELFNAAGIPATTGR